MTTEAKKDQGATTVWVQAHTAVLGMQPGDVAELADTEYLRSVIGTGKLSKTKKPAGR